jgi:hypothetical protein
VCFDRMMIVFIRNIYRYVSEGCGVAACPAAGCSIDACGAAACGGNGCYLNGCVAVACGLDACFACVVDVLPWSNDSEK